MEMEGCQEGQYITCSCMMCNGELKRGVSLIHNYRVYLSYEVIDEL